MIGRRPNFIDVFLLRVWYRVLGLDIERSGVLDVVGPQRDDPDIGYNRYALLAVLWGVVYGVFELTWLAVWGALRGIDAVSHQAFLPVFLFAVGFCIAGAVDALWRMWVMWSAKQRKQHAGEQSDRKTLRLVRLAGLNDGTLVLQVVVGLVLAIVAS